MAVKTLNELKNILQQGDLREPMTRQNVEDLVDTIFLGAYGGNVSVTSSSSYTIPDDFSDALVLVNDITVGSEVSITLPDTSVFPRTVLTIKKIGNLYDVDVLPASGTIDGQAVITLNAQYDSVTLTHDGTNWFIL